MYSSHDNNDYNNYDLLNKNIANSENILDSVTGKNTSVAKCKRLNKNNKIEGIINKMINNNTDVFLM